MGSRNWPGKLDLMNVILTGVAEELPGKGPGYELHRLLGTLFPSELTVNEKLGIIETEYHITMEDNIRKDVIGNLGQGIRERGEAVGKEAKKIATIKRMHQKGYSIEMIADTSDKTSEEVEAILMEQELQTTGL